MYGTGLSDANTRLRWFDRSGKPLGEPFGEPAESKALAMAPDGSRFAATIADPATGSPDIWVFDSRGVRTRLTFGAVVASPVWSPTAPALAYARVEKGDQTIICVEAFRRHRDRGDALPHGGNGVLAPDDWSADGVS